MGTLAGAYRLGAFMRISTWRLLIPMVVLLCLGAVAVACGGDDEGSFRNGIEIISLDGDGQGDPAADGDSVGVRYRGTLDDGSEFDSNAGRGLLPVTIGAGAVIPGFEEALRGLRIGQTIVVRIPAALAYGPRDESLIVQLPRAQTPPGMLVGQRVRLGDGPPSVVTEINDDFVTIDANHELAGQALTFEISIETLE